MEHTRDNKSIFDPPKKDGPDQYTKNIVKPGAIGKETSKYLNKLMKKVDK